MRKFVAAAIVSVAVAAGSFVGTGPAFAQADASPRPDALAQMGLNDDLVKQFIETQPDIEAAMGQATDSADVSDPKMMAKLEEVVKKHKFQNYGQFETVAGNIALVLQGVDPKTKKFIGAEAEIKQEIAALKTNTEIPADDKKAEIAELEDELKEIVPVKFKSNIDVVLRYYDQLGAAPAK